MMNCRKWNHTGASAEGVQVRAVQKQNKKNLPKRRGKLSFFCYWNVFMHQHLLMTLQISTSDNQMFWHTRLLMWNWTVPTAPQQNKQSKRNTWKKTSCITQTLGISGGTLLALATPEIRHVSRANQFSQRFASFGTSKSCFSTGGWSRWFSRFPSSQKFLWY